jgi:hypothetical protein
MQALSLIWEGYFMNVFVNDKSIPVSFVCSDARSIPQLLKILESRSEKISDIFPNLTSIEVVGNVAILHTSSTDHCLPLN